MGFSYSPKVITDGLVLYLDAANPLSYASGSTQWRDLSRGKNHGTLTNGPAFDSANKGSIVFDGANDYTYLESSNQLRFGTGGFSVSAWVYPTSTANVRIVNDRGTGGFQYPGYQFKMEQTGTEWYFNDCAVRDGIANNQYNNIGVRYSLNQWYYVTMNYIPQTRVEYYVNGEISGIDTSNIPQNSIDNNLPTVIGAAVSADGVEGTTSQFFGGNIAQAKIYNRALTAQEVQRNYQALKSRFEL